jgi:hypothetical protein
VDNVADTCTFPPLCERGASALVGGSTCDSASAEDACCDRAARRPRNLTASGPPQVISYLPNTLKVLVRVAAVCTSWRAAVLEADPVSGDDFPQLLSPPEPQLHRTVSDTNSQW